MVKTGEWETVNQASRAVDARQERHHARAVRRVLQADQLRLAKRRWPARTTASRAHRIHPAAVHPGQGADGHVEPRQGGRRQALRQARLHHGRRRRRCCRATCASSRAWSIRPTCRSTCRRELLQESRAVKAIREGCTKRVLSMIEDLAANDAGKIQPRFLRRIRRGAERRPGRRLRQPRAPGQAAALCQLDHRHRQRRALPTTRRA